MNENIRVTPMTAEHAIKEWDTISSVLAKVLNYACDRYTMDDVKDRIASGSALVLLVWDPEEKIIYAALVAEAELYPNKKVFSLSMLGGEKLEEWGHLFPVVKYIAKKLGYDQIDVVGRPGWGKFMPNAVSVATCYTEDL